MREHILVEPRVDERGYDVGIVELCGDVLPQRRVDHENLVGTFQWVESRRLTGLGFEHNNLHRWAPPIS